jgi:RNA polymerase sigma-70 factor (ECF subfamily)
MDSSITFGLPNLAVSGEIERTSEAPPSDEALLQQVCAGSREALAVLFRRYARAVRGVAVRVLRDTSEADDLVQDVFLLVNRLCGTFDASKATAQFWILQMAFRRALSQRRRLSSRHFYAQLELDDQSTEVAESGNRGHDFSIEQRLAELDLQKLFGALSDDQQRTLRLHFVEGYTLDEIAKMLGQTKGNVRHHSFRGLERLRKLIFASKLSGARAV